MPSLGLLQRKAIWFPTRRGWVLILITSLLLMAGSVLTVVPFLGPTRPVHQGILVVEGWLPDYALAEAKKTFESHRYRVVVVAGVPIDIGFHISSEKNYAQLGASTLKHLGLKEELIAIAPCQQTPRNRTYATAVKIRAWLDANAAQEPIDVFTLGVHARRTWLLYRMALGDNYRVGIISGTDQRYDRRQWWRTSSGVRLVIDEAIAYLYAKFLFYPGGKEALEAASD